MTLVLAVGITTCPAFPESSMEKPRWRISNDSTTVHLQERTNFAACPRARAAANLPATIASQGIRCLHLLGLDVMATIEGLDVCHPNRPWDTKVNIGQPL